jgi:hypothetical protein
LPLASKSFLVLNKVQEENPQSGNLKVVDREEPDKGKLSS